VAVANSAKYCNAIALWSLTEERSTIKHQTRQFYTPFSSQFLFSTTRRFGYGISFVHDREKYGKRIVHPLFFGNCVAEWNIVEMSKIVFACRCRTGTLFLRADE
jgi:hypothetical protein